MNTANEIVQNFATGGSAPESPEGYTLVKRGGQWVPESATAAAAAAVAGLNLGAASESATSIACWGDSLTRGYGFTPYPIQLTASSGFKTYNGGVGGDTSTQIKVRMIADTARHEWNTIIWAGRNNYSSAATVLADVAAMVSALGHSRYSVLSILNSDGEPFGSGEYAAIIALNAQLASIYGARFIDVRSRLIADGLALAGITATAQDTTDISNSIVPSSLRTDGIHLNTSGYFALAATLNQTAIPAFVAGSGLVAASVTDLLKMLQSPPAIGTKTPEVAFFKALTAESVGFGGNAYITQSGDGSLIQTHGGIIPDGDGAYVLGLSPTAYRWAYLFLSEALYLRETSISRGTGSPEGVTAAKVGSLYLREDGGDGTTLYVKQSGTGNTGWAAK